eukprot:TRINITY_DN3438_c0_g1_i1.p6 TRINITY_DN3438_c0_g1~~TRINITY_DN3438_c0_g1_i1.p6  ORF type:complete len:110 (+),score=33.19 TRINITY_DN3438_c0_g1_i1:653-982(+)
MVNFFEKENVDADGEETVRSFDLLFKKTSNPTIRGNPEVAKRAYEYWKEVRESRGGRKGLLKKYWKAPDPINNDPRVTFRRSKDEKRNLRRNRKYDEDYLKQVFAGYNQ